mmetsp:Transcript_29139/g.113177  ORF Transcript_29139/g.113177 Transcript_29139/m.113177 type:complete len:261 (+) Transcript_29139:961-1743(+)
MHPASVRFCRQVLGSREVIRYIDENVIFWARGIASPEGYRAQRLLGVTTYPFVALITSPPGRSDGVTLSEYNSDAGDFLQWLQTMSARFGTTLTRRRLHVEERDEARQLREQQDREYHETLEADRRREQAAKEAAEQAAEQERLKREAEEEELRKRAELVERREGKRVALGEEPEKGPGVTTIGLRLPDGKRVDRRFLVSDKVAILFDWADINGVSIEHAALVSSFPRRTYQYPEDADKTLEEAGLSQGTMLLVEERADL